MARLKLTIWNCIRILYPLWPNSVHQFYIWRRKRWFSSQILPHCFYSGAILSLKSMTVNNVNYQLILWCIKQNLWVWLSFFCRFTLFFKFIFVWLGNFIYCFEFYLKLWQASDNWHRTLYCCPLCKCNSFLMCSTDAWLEGASKPYYLAVLAKIQTM